MAEVKIINDVEKNNNIKDEENFLSKKEFNKVEKIELNESIKNLNAKDPKLDENLATIENKENIDDGNIIANTEIKKNKEKKFSIKTNSVLQEKLKKIFLVREKRKFEYNKQEIPENLKYHSDSSSSEKEQKNQKNEKINETKKISVIKRQNSGKQKKPKDNNTQINEKSKEDKENNSPNTQKNFNNKKLDNKKTKSFNQKIVDNYIKEENKNEDKEKKQNKNTALKDIIEKLKAKKIEKDELTKNDKEEKTKEVTKKIFERKNEKEKVLKEENINKEKNNVNKNKNNKNKNLIPNKDKKKNYKRAIHSKNLSKNESILLPHKTYRDENDDEINSFNFYEHTKRNQSSSKIVKEPKNEEIKESKKERIYNRRKKLNSIDMTIPKITQQKKLTNIEMNSTIYNTNKKPDNSYKINNTINIYKPKKPALTKAGSRLRIRVPQNPLINKNNCQMKTGFFNNNNSAKNIFDHKVKYNIVGNNPYVKKPKLNLFNNMNNSYCDLNNESMTIGNNNNATCFDINNVNNLNSSFDSLIKYNKNAMYTLNLNNNIYNNNLNIFPGRITSSSFLQNQNSMPQMQIFNYSNPQTTRNNINYNTINTINASNNNDLSSVNIEDLLILEEKLFEIIKSLNKTKMIHNECFEFWNYYFNCSLYCKLEKLFTNIYESNEVRISINYLLMTVLICYDYSFNINIINNSYQIFDGTLKLNRENLILIFKHVLTKIRVDNRDNIWVFKLNDLVNSNLNLYGKEYANKKIVDIINNNSGLIIQNISCLLTTFKTENSIFIFNFLQNLHTKNYDDIDKFFRERILRVENINGSVLASIFLKENHIFKTEPAPYLKTINRKPYSLILDLDETLVHFKVNPDNGNEGVLRVRPGIIEFLESVDKYYELIIFTAATQEYADILIDAVEENKIYFEQRLYRQHTVIIGNDFVKDLSRVGRPLDKIAIVDNMPQNFRLQKENGINIKAFWGEEVYDTALIDLGKILVNIAKDGGDIRDGIYKYKDEILKKVTSNISKH